jgi:lambda family phage portal protein
MAPEALKKRQVFAGADLGRLYSSWSTTNYSADSEIYNDLRVLRARSRELERNNDYAKKFFRMVKTNVVGKEGIKLQSQAKNSRGKPDEAAREKIEEQFKEWSKKGVCDVTGEYSFRDIQKMVISSIARDGEIIIRKVKGFDNPYRFALQLLEADHLDEKYSEMMPSGNRIKMGIEFDGWSRPVAYWVYKMHPGDFLFGEGYGDKIRIPADEILHIHLPYRVSQTRGLPWIHAALTRLNMLGAYEEAELVASRIAAAKGGFYQSDGSVGEYQGDDTENNNPIQEVEPGIFELLPPGLKFQVFDPQHPTNAYEAFTKSILRGIASGLDVSYNYLANDLEGVNYSSIRAGVLDERDVWRDLQAFLAEHFLQSVFEPFLDMALLTQKIPFSHANFEKYTQTRWQPRGWAWVDPLKDMQAKILGVNSGFDTGANIAAETGQDLEEIYQQLAIEKQLREKYQLMLSQLEEKSDGSFAPSSD